METGTLRRPSSSPTSPASILQSPPTPGLAHAQLQPDTPIHTSVPPTAQTWTSHTTHSQTLPNSLPSPSGVLTQRIAGSRRRNRRCVQAVNPLHSAGITDAVWAHMASIDAVPILKQNIIALDKCPTHFRNLWRFAVSEVNQAGQSHDPVIRRGAEFTLALLPNMLLRAPSAKERLMSTRQENGLKVCQILLRGLRHSCQRYPPLQRSVL